MANGSKLGKFLSGFLGTSGPGGSTIKSLASKAMSDVPASTNFNASGFLKGSKIPTAPNTARGRAIASTWGKKTPSQA